MKFASLIEQVLDAILPPRERTRRTKALALESVPLSPAVHELLGTRITTLMDYRAQAAQDLVQSLKYDGGAHAASLCAALLAEYLAEELASDKLFTQKEVLLVPVPLHASRMRERGFNQIALILERLPIDLRDGSKARLESDALVRTRKTKAQTRLSRAERLSNVAGAFALADSARIKGCRVFLIDDVTTTGATLVNAGNCLRRAGAEVTLLSLARA